MTAPKIFADGFSILSGAFGFAVVVLQFELPIGISDVDAGGNLKAEKAVEIRMSPRVAKALAAALAQNVGKYEDDNGEIVEPSAPGGKMN